MKQGSLVCMLPGMKEKYMHSVPVSNSKIKK